MPLVLSRREEEGIGGCEAQGDRVTAGDREGRGTTKEAGGESRITLHDGKRQSNRQREDFIDKFRRCSKVRHSERGEGEGRKEVAPARP